MRIRVTAEGVLIPKNLLGDSEVFEVEREGDRISVVPVAAQPAKAFADIQAILLALKSTLQEHYQATTLGIFGSYARQEQQENSDVDILIDYIHSPSLIKVVELRDFLSDRLGMKVDIVTVKGLRDDIKAQVLSEVIYLWNAED